MSRRGSVGDALQDSELIPEGGILTSYVVIATYLDGDGKEGLARWTSEDLAWWQRLGLLYAGLAWDEEVEDDEDADS